MGFRWGLVLSLVLFFSLACFAESTPTHQNDSSGNKNQAMPALKSNPMAQMMGSFSSMMPQRSNQGRGASGQDDSDAFAKQIAEGTKKVGETANKAQSDFSAAMQKLNEEKDDGSSSVSSSIGKITESIGSISSASSNSQSSVDSAYNSLLQSVNSNASQTSALTAALQQQQEQPTTNRFSNQNYNPDPLGFAFVRTQELAEDIRPGNSFIHNTYSAPHGISLR